MAMTLSFLLGCAVPAENTADAGSPAAGMTRIAGQLLARGDLAGAADFYQRALQHDPDNIAARKGMAEIFEKTDNYEKAADEYRHLAKLKPGDIEIRKNLGRVTLSLDRPIEAREAYKAALDLDGSDVKAMNGMAIALDNLGEHEKAQKYYESALEKEPGNLNILNNLAYSKILTGNYSEAIELLEPHIKHPKATVALRQNLALAYGLSGMMLDAERVAKMDLPPHKVKESLEYYKLKRAETEVETAPYAELGTYATEAMAEAEIHKIQSHMDELGVDLSPVIMPKVSAPGGTPRFAVRLMGCTRPDDVKAFCDMMKKRGLPCVPRKTE